MKIRKLFKKVLIPLCSFFDFENCALLSTWLLLKPPSSQLEFYVFLVHDSLLLLFFLPVWHAQVIFFFTSLSNQLENWDRKKFDSCKYNFLKTFLNRFFFGVHSELRHFSLITLLGVFHRSCLRRLQFQRLCQDKKYFTNFYKFSKIISVFRKIELFFSLMVFPGQVRWKK